MIDSEFQTSGSGSNFTVELADALQCNSTAQRAVIAVSFPASFFTIEYNVNDRLYVLENWTNIVNCRILQIPAGQFDGQTFGDALEAVLNGEDRIQTGYNYDVFYAAAEGRFVIQWGSDPSPTRSWMFLSDADLMDGSFWYDGVRTPGAQLRPGPRYDKTRLMSCKHVIRLEEWRSLKEN